MVKTLNNIAFVLSVLLIPVFLYSYDILGVGGTWEGKPDLETDLGLKIENDSINTLTYKTIIAPSNVLEQSSTTVSSATLTPPGSNLRVFFKVTGLAVDATFAAPSGTPHDGNYLTIRIKDDGTARTLTWNAIYRDNTGIGLPYTTVANTTAYFGFRYNDEDSKWDMVAR